METPELSAEEQTMANMRAAGVTVDEPAFEDYFGFEEKRKFYLPDGKQYIEFKLMDEGARSRYQQATTRDVTLNRMNNDAKIKMDAAAERRTLLEASVTGWFMMRKNKDTGAWDQVTFSTGSGGSTFMTWLDHANPSIVNDLELAIRKANPWMVAEQTVKAIEEEIENLKEQLEEAKKREEGKDAS